MSSPILLAASDAAPASSSMHISPWAWVATVAFVVGLILFDLIKHHNPHAASVKEAAWSSVGWTVLGVAFVLPVWWLGNSAEASQYFTGYLLERALSIDNVFVFVVILSYFAVPPKLQHHALLWGVVGALVLRVIFILVGAALIERFDWTLAIFGAILVFTAIKLARSGDEDDVDPSKNVALKLLRKITPVSNEFNGPKLFTKDPKTLKRIATPMLAVLVVIGTTDLIFAVDSIPAVYGVTTIPFIVFAANAFSLLGLRSLSVLLAGVMDRFIYLKPALALVLGLIGTKMILEYFTPFHPPVWVPLLAIVVLIGGGIALSLLKTRNNEPHEHSPSLSAQGEPQS